jgi:hypothetical protein
LNFVTGFTRVFRIAADFGAIKDIEIARLLRRIKPAVEIAGNLVDSRHGYFVRLFISEKLKRSED